MSKREIVEKKEVSSGDGRRGSEECESETRVRLLSLLLASHVLEGDGFSPLRNISGFFFNIFFWM